MPKILLQKVNLFSFWYSCIWIEWFAFQGNDFVDSSCIFLEYVGPSGGSLGFETFKSLHSGTSKEIHYGWYWYIRTHVSLNCFCLRFVTLYKGKRNNFFMNYRVSTCSKPFWMNCKNNLVNFWNSFLGIYRIQTCMLARIPLFSHMKLLM